ncbi:MAG: glycosyltransferase family 39 protein, partial [Crocinitomicaceae bacterium]|nr:glycosyltransferase family 39 protein [Crocinitomicaceae bacterium]
MRLKYIVFFIAFLGTTLAVLWQESNLAYLEINDPYRTKDGIIRTTDDASYVQPPKNLKSRGMWRDNSIGNSSYFQRPPGYGLIYLASSYIYPSNSYVPVKIIQVIGFFFSIILVFSLLSRFGLDRKWSLIATAIYASLPSFSGFIYHSITEGITPVLLLWSIYEWTKLLQKDAEKIQMLGFLCFFSSGFLLLVRPQLIVFMIVFILYLMLKRRIKLATLSLLIFVPFAVWEVRVMSISGSMELHPIYSYTNHSFYRP